MAAASYWLYTHLTANWCGVSAAAASYWLYEQKLDGDQSYRWCCIGGPNQLLRNLERMTICGKAIPKNPRGLRPLGFLALGLAEDVALGLLLENPSGLQSTPRGRLITLGTTLGHRFTWLPPRLFHRLSHFFCLQPQPNQMLMWQKNTLLNTLIETTHK